MHRAVERIGTRVPPVRPSKFSRLIVGLIVVGAVSAAAYGAGRIAAYGSRAAPPERSTGRLTGGPRLILWAWERPELLDFIDPHQVGVAFLARTLFLRSDRVVVRPRFQPLRVPPGTALTAVVRIQSEKADPPTLSPAQGATAVAAMIQVTRLPGVTGLQIDFDALASERAFYRALLSDLHRQLQPPTALSMTALASWCMFDDWITGLPVAEAVPMLFQMGPGQSHVVHRLAAGQDFRPRLCRQSIGIATDELPRRLPRGRRLYVFHPRPWSPAAVEQIVQGARQWR